MHEQDRIEQSWERAKLALAWLASVRVQLPFLGWGRFAFERSYGRRSGEEFWLLELGIIAVSRDTSSPQTVGERGVW